MLQKLRGNSKGFTLIELMIVIAIIGILAAIAIPNFIAYRNKAFCSKAESDANSLAAEIADYYAVPTRTACLTEDDLSHDENTPNTANVYCPNGTGAPADGDPTLGIAIEVVDVSGRCPDEYQGALTAAQNATGYWDAATDTYIKTLD